MYICPFSSPSNCSCSNVVGYPCRLYTSGDVEGLTAYDCSLELEHYISVFRSPDELLRKDVKSRSCTCFRKFLCWKALTTHLLRRISQSLLAFRPCISTNRLVTESQIHGPLLSFPEQIESKLVPLVMKSGGMVIGLLGVSESGEKRSTGNR
jgi:hypothetical protein